MQRIQKIFGEKRPLVLVGLLLGVLLFWKCVGHTLGWTYIYRFPLLAGLEVAVFFLLQVEKKNVLLFMTCIYFVGSALYFAAGQEWNGIPTNIVAALHLEAAMFLVFLLSAILFASLFREYNLWVYSMKCLQLSAWVIAISAFFMVDSYQGIPIYHNPSMAGSFLAVVLTGVTVPLPFFVFIPAILLLKTSTPLAALIVGLLVRERRRVKQLWWAFLPFLGVLAFYAYPKMTNGNGRYAIWKMTLHWFLHQAPMIKLFGTGPGSAMVLVPILQVANHLDMGMSEFYVYLHNDWLQILVETGFVGLALAVLFYLGAFRRVKDAKWQGMLASFGVVMCTNFPWHSPLTAFLGLVLFTGAYLG